MSLRSMYANLLQLPLFNGVTYDRLTEIIGSTKLSFLKYIPGENIFTSGTPCRELTFVIGGKVRLSISNRDNSFDIHQTIESPSVIYPEFLFGRNTSYPFSATAIDDVSAMQIEKKDFISIIRFDEIVLFNYLNIISSNAQKSIDGVIALTTGSLEERIAFWIVAMTQRDAKDIVVSCRHSELHSFFGVSRSSFLTTLESMKGRGLIDFSPFELRVASRRELRSMLLDRTE